MAQSGGVLKRVPDPQNPGKFVEAQPLRIVSGDLDAVIQVELEDGVKVRITLSVVEISRINDRKDANGRPIYNVDSRGVIHLEFPPGVTQ